MGRNEDGSGSCTIGRGQGCDLRQMASLTPAAGLAFPLTGARHSCPAQKGASMRRSTGWTVAGTAASSSPGHAAGRGNGGDTSCRGRGARLVARLRAQRRMRNRDARVQLRGERRRGGPPGPVLGGHVLRVHDRQRPRQQHRRPRLHLAGLGLRSLHGRVFRLHRPSRPLAMGAIEHADVARRVPVRRALGDVLRRRPGRSRQRHRVRLPRRGDGALHFSDATFSSATSPMLRSSASRPAPSTPSPSSTRAPVWPISSGNRMTAGRARRPTSGRSS